MEPSDKKPCPPATPTHSSSSSSSSSSALMGTRYRYLASTVDLPISSPSHFLAHPSSPSPLLPIKPKIEPPGDILEFPSFSPPSVPPTSLRGEAGEGEATDVPRPLEALQGTPIPPFLSKTYDIVDDSSLDPVVSWGPTGKSFVVWDPVEFARAVLPRHFKHNNFSSFVRQLNTYVESTVHRIGGDWSVGVGLVFLQGFRKIEADRWEFANEDFLKGSKGLLKNIIRRRSSQVQQVSTQIGSSELASPAVEGELHTLRREKHTLMQEVAKLKQEHITTIQQVGALNQRLQSAEEKQKQMVSFLAKLLKNPEFLARLKQQKEQKRIASPRPKRKFLKHQEVVCRDFLEAVTQQSGEDILEITAPASSYGLQELTGVLAETGEEFGTLFLESDAAAFKNENLESAQTDIGAQYSVSFPVDIDPDKALQSTVFPPSSRAGSDPTIADPKGKNVIDLKLDVASSVSEYLISFPEDSSFENTWSVGLGAGESFLSSDYTIWDSIGHDFQQLEVGAEPGTPWDLDLQALEEQLVSENSVHDDSPSHEKGNQKAVNRNTENMEP
ncbi:Heat stress transcription factor A-3, partial [Ananas comosus]